MPTFEIYLPYGNPYFETNFQESKLVLQGITSWLLYDSYDKSEDGICMEQPKRQRVESMSEP